MYGEWVASTMSRSASLAMSSRSGSTCLDDVLTNILAERLDHELSLRDLGVSRLMTGDLFYAYQ